jgi:hypothetical protein
VGFAVINVYYTVTAANQFEDNVMTMVHELTHALGFSEYMFDYWIDDAGN